MWALAHHLLLGVAVAALAAASLRLAAAAAPAGGLARAVAAVPLFGAGAVLSALGLGLIGLGASPVALTLAALAGWLAARTWIAAPAVSPWADLARWWRGLSPAARLAFGALAGLLVVYAAWLTRYPYVGVDGLGYHLPDVVAWVGDGRPGSRNHVLPLIPVESYPITDEVLLTWFAGISRGFAFIAPFQLGLLVLLGASLRLGLRELGVRTVPAVAAVAAMVTVPLVVGELSGPLTDLPALAWLACTGGLCAAAVKRPALLGPALVAAGLAVGTKTTTLPAATVALVLSGLAIHRGGGRLPAKLLGLAALAAFGVGGFWYLRNLVVHGSPMWPLVSTPWGDPQPEFLKKFDVRFISVPGDTLSRHWHSYRVELAGSLALMAGALVAPLLVRRRRVLVASACGIGLVLVWMSAPYTGIAPRPVFEELAVSTIRYLLPAILACCVAVAVGAGESGWGARTLLAVLAGAIVWNVVEDLRTGFPYVPSEVTLVLALAGGALVTAALGALAGRVRLPGRAIAVGLGVAACAALAVGAGGYLDRHGDVRYVDGDLAHWFADRPGFAQDDRPVAQTPIVNGLLTGDRVRHPVPLVENESCARVRARAREGWVVVGDTPFADYNRVAQRVERCLAGVAAPVKVVPGFRVYGGP